MYSMLLCPYAECTARPGDAQDAAASEAPTLSPQVLPSDPFSPRFTHADVVLRRHASAHSSSGAAAAATIPHRIPPRSPLIRLTLTSGPMAPGGSKEGPARFKGGGVE